MVSSNLSVYALQASSFHITHVYADAFRAICETENEHSEQMLCRVRLCAYITPHREAQIFSWRNNKKNTLLTPGKKKNSISDLCLDVFVWRGN